MRVGLDLGGSKLLGVLLDDRGVVVRRTRRQTGRALGPAAAMTLLKETVTELDGPMSHIGVGFPGLVHHGVVRSSVMLDGWHDEPLATRLSEHFGVPCAVDNDVNTAAWAEAVARPELDSFAFIAVGTGIGGALVTGGRLWTGARGLAGEVGHVTLDPQGDHCRCGRRGCLATYAAGEILANGGSRERAILALGEAIADLFNLLDPQAVILGGGVACGDADLVLRVEQIVQQRAMSGARCRVEIARAGYDAGAVGAALLEAPR